MKIAILSPFTPYRGGIAQFSGMLYTSLVEMNQDVCAFNFTRLYPDLLFPGKTQYIDAVDSLPIESVRCLDSINPISYFKTVHDIEQYAPDVLIISYWISFFVPAYAHVANRLKKQCKVITLLHNAIPHEPRFFDQFLAKILFKQSDAFIVLSENVAQDLLAMKPRAKYLLTPHPLYDHFGKKIAKNIAQASLGIDSSKKTLLFFGLIRDYKGLDLLIQAMDLLDEDYQLVVAGECYGSFDKYQALIDCSQAGNRIKVYNQYIDDADVATFFSAADALVLPYRSATQSGVVSLAYHFDLPMLATNVGDFYNSIVRPNIGVIASEITPESIGEAVQTLFAADNMATYRQNIAQEKLALSWHVFAEKLLVFIGQLS